MGINEKDYAIFEAICEDLQETIESLDEEVYDDLIIRLFNARKFLDQFANRP